MGLITTRLIANRSAAAWLPLAAALLLAGCSKPEERAENYAREAVTYFDQGDVARAKLEARNALQLAPKNVPARFLLARIAEQEGEVGQLLGHLEVVIAEDPTHVESRLMLAKLLIGARDFEGLKLIMDQLAKLAPDNPEYQVLTARLKFQAEDLPAGIAILDQVLAKYPKNTEAVLLRGFALSASDPAQALADLATAAAGLDAEAAKPLRQARIEILSRQKDAEGVERELRALVADYPKGGYATDLANFLVATGRVDDAEAALRAAITADPGNFDLKYALAQFLSRARNEPAAAEATLKEFVAAQPDEPRLAVLLGTFYEASGRPEDAMVQYQAVATRNATAATGLEARARIATLQFNAGDLATARTGYDAVLADSPDNVPALTGRGQLNLAEGKFQDAIADLRGALRKDPDNATALLSLARAHRGLGDASLARDAYRSLLQADRGQVAAATELGVLLQATGELADAEQEFRAALEAQPNYVPAGSGLVEVLIAKGDFAAADAEARRLVALNDALGIGQIQLGKVLQGRRDYAGATAAFRAALARDPKSTVALRGLAGSLTLAGDLEAAGKAIEAFVAANPDNADAQLLLAGNLVRRSRFEAARAAGGKATELAPADARGWIVLAGTWPDDPAAREQVLRKGIAAAPTAVELTDILGSDLLAGGRVDDAIALYDAALTLNPRDRRLANSLAALLLDAKADDASHRRALELAQPFADSRDAAELDTLGWAHYRLRDFGAATGFLERALAAQADNPIIRYHLGMAYKAANNTAGARQELEKALAAGSGFPGAAEARKALDDLRGAASAG
jgi:tetratricopeptide (TPR) repeat protein